MKTLRIILGDHLSHSISSLADVVPETDLVLMCEVIGETQTVNHHKKKLIFLFSAMRHFAAELERKGLTVRYVNLDDPDSSGSFTGEVARAIDSFHPDRIVMVTPGEHRVLNMVNDWQRSFDVVFELREDDRFLCPGDTFSRWASSRKTLRMEHFYQQMRKTHNVLMAEGKPEGGKWNFDAENRNPLTPDTHAPSRFSIAPDQITQDVITLVSARLDHHFGDPDGFHFAVTRTDALAALDDFIENRLARFGDFQDAMREGDPWLFHAHISLYLNVGLLLPRECIRAAERAWYEGSAPLNAVEGFVRQILGWREYVRGIYWHFMPDYQHHNFFEAGRPLPDFYWTGQTQMNCVRQAVLDTKQHAYAHHIQRLMVLGNFALIAGIDPRDVNDWFLAVYADAFEWVEMPNVTGMALFADGGLLASKPYASGGNYINRMSDYCQGCHYKPTRKNGQKACPFNYLYWDFLDRNRTRLDRNHRLAMMYRTHDRMSEERKQAIRDDSRRFLKDLS